LSEESHRREACNITGYAEETETKSRSTNGL